MTTDEITPALRQAEFLVALAAHLCAHPRLGEVHIDGDRLHIVGDEQSAELIPWARSLGVEQLTAMAIDDEDWSCVGFWAEIGPTQVRVWARIDGLPRTATELTVDELEQFRGEPR